MELNKKNIQMNREKGSAKIQTTIDKDFNVPDIKPDIEKIIKEKADVRIKEVEVGENKCVVRGELLFAVLYLSDGYNKPIHSMNGKCDFEERVNIANVSANDTAMVNFDIEDIRTSLINSRKLSIKSVITLGVSVEDSYYEEVAESAEGEDSEVIYQNIEVSQLAVNKKDTYRVRDELIMPQNKPNIEEVVWTTADICDADIKILDDKINIRGNIKLFVMYIGQNEDTLIECMNMMVPFHGDIECTSVKQEMIPNILLSIADKDIEVKMDQDGEPRCIDCEFIIELNIKIYSEENYNVIKDIYSPKFNTDVVTSDAHCNNILYKNTTVARMNEKVQLDNRQGKVMQICNAEAMVKVDEVNVVDGGLEVEGIVLSNILYIAEDDLRPINAIKSIAPFKAFVEVKGMGNSSTFDLNALIESISATMIDSDTIEIKAIINLDTIVFDKVHMSVITDINVTPVDQKKLNEAAGIIGYVVQKGEKLWDIGKRFHVGIDQLKKCNHLESDQIQKGDKLLIIK